MIWLALLFSYTVAGVIAAIGFVSFGIGQIMPRVPVTWGARIMLVPGAFALWPLVLGVWVRARRQK